MSAERDVDARERDRTTAANLDVHRWREQMRNGYIRMHLLYALEETNVFDALRRADGAGKTAAELSDECNLEPQLLEGALNYLAFSDVVLSKADGRFALTERGHDWLGQDATLNVTYMMAAYAAQLEQLVPALRREKRYGTDFVRDGALLAFASWKGARASYLWIVDELRTLGVSTVADLGCGAGGLLLEFCRLDPALRGIGVDIDPQALEEARWHSRTDGFDDRIRFVQGDVSQPETFAADVADAQAFNALGVVHELLRDGEAPVLRMFQAMKELFAGRYLLLGEFNPIPDEGWSAMPLEDRTKKLHYQHIMHPMSFQGLPISRERWFSLFERAGIECLKVQRFFVDEYVLRL